MYVGLTLGVKEVLQYDHTACSKVQSSQHYEWACNAGVAVFCPQSSSLKWFETEAENSVQPQNNTALKIKAT